MPSLLDTNSTNAALVDSSADSTSLLPTPRLILASTSAVSNTDGSASTTASSDAAAANLSGNTKLAFKVIQKLDATTAFSYTGSDYTKETASVLLCVKS